jgi:MoaA/NifB/PqqE/SkfB family radical SAM enzyme
VRRLTPDRVKSAWHRVRRAGVARVIKHGRDYVHYTLLRSPLFNRVHRVGIRPHELYIEGTNICNAKCVFCAYPQMERAKVTMPMETFTRVVDEYLKLGLGEVDLTPIVGDPFVDKHLFARLDYLAGRPEGLGFHFYTNAILMRPGWIERLVAYGSKLTIFCSFGGFDRDTYHAIMGVDKYDDALANIRGLIEEKKRTGSTIKIVINLRVPHGSERGEFWDYLVEQEQAGLVLVHSAYDYDNWGGKIADADLIKVRLLPKPAPPREGACYRLLIGPTVLADGRVNACCCRDVEATLIIGDVKRNSLAEIFSGPEIKDLIARHERGDFPDACKTCTQYAAMPMGLKRLFRA